MNCYSPITLCLIVKDEEAFIEKCIRSVLPIVSDIVIMDTGSTDRTIEICEKLGAKVFHTDFSQGFSHARNLAIQRVKTEWILFLDADESFAPGEAKKLLSQILTADSEISALSNLRYNFFSGGGFYLSKTIKAFRKDPNIFYSGKIVDSVRDSLKEGKKNIQDTSIILDHFGHCRSLLERDRKAKKYLSLIEEELTVDSSNAKLLCYKALILRSIGAIESALLCIDALIASSDVPLAHFFFVRAQVYRALKRNDLAEVDLVQARELEPSNGLYGTASAILAMSRMDYNKAEQEFKSVLENNPSWIHTKINLGLLEQARGHFDKAVLYFTEVADQVPSFLSESFQACTEFDPYTGLMFDTVSSFRGLAYHLSYCQSKVKEAI